MVTPRLAKIRVYPIKSLDPVEVDAVRIAMHGMLENDRAFAIFEGSGGIIKAKDAPEVHQLHARVDLETLRAAFRIHGQEGEMIYHLDEDRVAIGRWLSGSFGRPVKLHRDARIGFADDWTATGPTLISTATLELVASWFPDLNVEEVRRRLRANLEIDGVPAFWEDQLYGPGEGERVTFRIGEVELLGKNACQRCPVPGRDVETGAKTRGFSKTFVAQRKATLPPWAHRARFDHFYRVAINTLPGTIGENAELRVGDALDIVGTATAPTDDGDR